jgi:LuxR family maltose regulon positive regulatory protein
VQGLIDRYDLVATRDRVVGKRNDHLGARRQREGVAAARVGRPAGPGPPDRPHVRMAGPARRAAVLARAAGAVRAATGGAESLPAAPEFNGQAMVDKVLSELAVPGGPFVLIIDDLHELSSGYGENARAGVKAHLDTVTERGRV